MRNFLKRLSTFNIRDLQGLIVWLIAGIVIGLFALPILVVREYYQYKHYHLSRFEWEDIIRYSFVIIVGSVIHILLWQQ
jgi:hypothetical protein